LNYATTDPGFWGRFPEHLKYMDNAAKLMGVEGATFVLGDPNDETAPAMAVMKMPPNFVLSRHSHRAERVEVIVSGSLDVGDRVLGPGDVMTAGYEEPYGKHVAGPEGCITVEIFSTLSGMHQTMFETPDGMQFVDLASAEDVEALAALME
jgi:anti-sigma factor ChrR (cupin superfamily)